MGRLPAAFFSFPAPSDCPSLTPVVHPNRAVGQFDRLARIGSKLIRFIRGHNKLNGLRFSLLEFLLTAVPLGISGNCLSFLGMAGPALWTGEPDPAMGAGIDFSEQPNDDFGMGKMPRGGRSKGRMVGT